MDDYARLLNAGSPSLEFVSFSGPMTIDARSKSPRLDEPAPRAR
jgi:hypothetical protein